MRLEERPDRREKGEDAGLGRDDVPGRSDDSRNERGERDGPQRDRRAGVGAEGIEQDRRRRVHDEGVPGREREVDEAACLEPSVAETGRQDGEEDRLRRPGEGQRVVRDELCGRHGDQGEGRRADDERERAVATLEREPRAGPHRRRRRGARARDRIRPRGARAAVSSADSRPGQRQGRRQRAQVASRRGRGGGGCRRPRRTAASASPTAIGGDVARPVPIGDESDRLRADDRGDGRQQRLPRRASRRSPLSPRARSPRRPPTAGVMPVSIAWSAGASAEPTSPMPARICEPHASATAVVSAAIAPASGRASASGTRS